MTKESPVIACMPFCADAMQKSMFASSIEKGSIAYVEVVSTTNAAPCACASAPISRTGFRTPVPVSWCVV